MNSNHSEKKGFTLIELLIVIAIVAILSVVVILTLNPAELLKQARDSNRISDLNVLKSAISLYLADGQAALSGNVCWQSIVPTSSNCGVAFTVSNNSTNSTSTAVTGAGWIPINFNLISSGAPLGSLPKDPLNNASYFYAYAGSSTFKIAAKALESSKFTTSPNDVAVTDGGTSSTVFEVGTNLQL